MACATFQHPTDGTTIIPILEQLLPYTLPLLNRIKFHHRSFGSHILATFQSSVGHDPRPPKCFAAAFVDRTRRPETECWLFLSGEVPGRCSLSSVSQCDNCKDALLSMMSTIKALGLPPSIHNLHDILSASPLKDNPEALIQITRNTQNALNGDVMLFGSVHECCEKIIREASPSCIIPPKPGLKNEAYLKYLFDTSHLPGDLELPEDLDLRWSPVRQQDFDLVRSRTYIPRQNGTLALLPSLALFRADDDRQPIAWAFLGPDSSLTSLHTESMYRGRGLAKILATRLFQTGGFEPSNGAPAAVRSLGSHPTNKWLCADVSVSNQSSRAVSHGLGGQEGWIVYWLRIDMSNLMPRANKD